MNEQEKKWREEFESWSENYVKENPEEWMLTDGYENENTWALRGYLTAKQSSQAIIDAQEKRIEELEARQVPDGWKLVPLRPTAYMLEQMTGEWHIDKQPLARERYSAMLLASPNYKEQP